jgi:hypothetical protein
MIVVSVMGGLGNQMFQYAFARGITEALDRRLILDLTMMPTGQAPYLRAYELHNLTLNRKTAVIGSGKIHGLELTGDRGLMRRFGSVARRATKPWRVSEPPSDVLLQLEEVPRCFAVCVGYWQSHHYFASISNEIRRELTPAIQSNGRVAEILRMIRSRESVMVHVRRGDYAEVRHVSDVHGLQSRTYYATAVRHIVDRSTDDQVAVVLSDDPVWASRHLDLGIDTIHVEAKSRLSAIDALALMSRCTHHVIANSSLSWWGAWLAEHPDQVVAYPARWFVDREVDRTIRFPSTWRPIGDDATPRRPEVPIRG